MGKKSYFVINKFSFILGYQTTLEENYIFFCPSYSIPLTLSMFLIFFPIDKI